MRLLILHGFTQNGEVLRTHAEPLVARFSGQLDCIFPNAPHACSEESVARLRSVLGVMQQPPHLCWWNATHDGRLYRGWDDSLELLRDAATSEEPFGLLGFSQGAIAAAVLAALAQRGDFAAPRFVVLVAGRIPRAEALKPMFEVPLRVPSLHVWGTRDVMAAQEAPKLADRFDPTTREVSCWDGPHVLPTFGSGADAITSFIRKQICV